MALLTPDDLKDINKQLQEADSIVWKVTGLDIKGVCKALYGTSPNYEAVRSGADIILMADDHTFLAHNLKNGKIANNQPSTGIIYAEIASRNQKTDSKDVLVVGLGKVGFPGAVHLVHKGFRVYGYDTDRTLLKRAVSSLGIIPLDIESPKKFSTIFEATPCANTIPETLISKNCVLSTPGIPCAISEELRLKYDVQLVMEPLGIGTASMLYSVL